MSQEKVDRYKEQKANRKQIIKKEKIKKVCRQCVLGVAGFAIVGWLGLSAYNSYMDKKPRQSVMVDYGNIQEYISSVTAE